MSNKNGPDTGDVPELLRQADALLEQVFYASSDMYIVQKVAEARRSIAATSHGGPQVTRTEA